MKKTSQYWMISAAAETLFVVALCCGCSRTTPEPASSAPTPLDAAELSTIIERHRGRVALVDFWATWCGPCVKLFPHTVELQRHLKDRGLTVIAVSLDDPAAAATVGRFLDRHGAKDEKLRFLSRYGVGPEAFEAFEINDGSLPHLRLYDRRGRLQRVFASGGQAIDVRELDRAIEELLATQDD
jgi:thiol-disulfide isomerase/thioredoxin